MCIHYAYFCFRSMIICFEIAVVCKIFDGQIVLLPWKQKYKHFEFFDLWYLQIRHGLFRHYIAHNYTSAVKRYLDLKMGQFLVF